MNLVGAYSRPNLPGNIFKVEVPGTEPATSLLIFVNTEPIRTIISCKIVLLMQLTNLLYKICLSIIEFHVMFTLQ